MDWEHATSATKSIVGASEVHCSDMELAKSGCTHDAWLYSHVQIGLAEYRGWVRVKYPTNGQKFRMPCTL